MVEDGGIGLVLWFRLRRSLIVTIMVIVTIITLPPRVVSARFRVSMLCVGYEPTYPTGKEILSFREVNIYLDASRYVCWS